MSIVPEQAKTSPVLRGRVAALVTILWFLALIMAIAILIAAASELNRWVTADTASPDAEILAPEIVIQITGILGIAFILMAALLSMGMSALLFWRSDRTFMVVLTSLFLMGYSVIIPGPIEAAVEHWPELAAAQVDSIIWSIYFAIGLTWLLWIFPNGQYFPRWTRYLILPLTIFSVWQSISSTGGTQVSSGIDLISQLILTLFILSSILAQVYRYFRVSTPTERQQTRWVLVGLALMLVLVGFSSIGYTTDPTAPVTTWRRIGGTLWSLGLSTIPLSLTFAILRYRLWAVDLIIRRTLMYAIITLVLALTYFGGVVMLQGVFVQITGQRSPLAVVASTLAIAALFNPLRTRVQNFIDWRFDRRKYDAQRTLDEFAASVRDEVDMTSLEQSLLGVVNETMQPESVSLWVREEREGLI